MFRTSREEKNKRRSKRNAKKQIHEASNVYSDDGGARAGRMFASGVDAIARWGGPGPDAAPAVGAAAGAAGDPQRVHGTLTW